MFIEVIFTVVEGEDAMVSINCNDHTQLFYGRIVSLLISFSYTLQKIQYHFFVPSILCMSNNGIILIERCGNVIYCDFIDHSLGNY